MEMKEKRGGVAIEFENPRDTDAIGKEFGDVEFYTINTIFPPDNMRNDAEFDYFADELFSNDNNIVFEIDRRQPVRSAIGKIHPNTSNELPSNTIIQQNSEKSTQKSNFSFKEDSDNNKNITANNENEASYNKKPVSYTKAEAVEMMSGTIIEKSTTVKVVLFGGPSRTRT